jgi:hypothetical protein
MDTFKNRRVAVHLFAHLHGRMGLATRIPEALVYDRETQLGCVGACRRSALTKIVKDGFACDACALIHTECLKPTCTSKRARATHVLVIFNLLH